MSKILVVDDEPSIVEVLTYNLTKAGHQPIVARDGERALELAHAEHPDLVILDLMLPGIDGLEVCRALRSSESRGDMAIIMLTAKDEEVDRVVGLELGADDYMVKPFSPRELMARVKAVLRRTRTKPANADLILTAGQLRLDVTRRQVAWRDKVFDVTTIQFELLHLMMANPGRVFSREELLNQVWGYDFYGDTRTVDSAIKRLRARLRLVSTDTDLVVTVRDAGYKLSDDV